VRGTFLSMARDNRGVAAAELAMVVPFMFVLLFGAFELGNYFMTEHAVVKAVRDGARYAARRPFTDYPGCVASAAVVDDTRNVTRTGQLAAGGEPRFASWSEPESIDVVAECDNAGGYTGVFVTNPDGAPVVTVTATVPYTPLFSQMGLGSVDLTLNARSQAAVTGI